MNAGINLPSYQQRYINLTKGDSITELITNHSCSLLDFFKDIPEEKADYSYAEGKWTVKQLLQHAIDTERILTYRAMGLSRNEPMPLYGFDENSYADFAPATHRTLYSLKEEFVLLRQSSDLLLTSFTDEQLARRGVINKNIITVNAICYILFGHNIHHQNILQEKYL
jgi:uncharacterized damage-inducible protein DinB